MNKFSEHYFCTIIYYSNKTYIYIKTKNESYNISLHLIFLYYKFPKLENFSLPISALWYQENMTAEEVNRTSYIIFS